MNALVNPEEKILCPYNSSHHIMKYRMNSHLVKCKKNYPDAKLVECDFNVNHMIPEPELQYHHENCPNRKELEITIYQDEGSDLNKYPVKNVDVETEESWDDLDVPSYDPKKYCEKNAVLRKMDVESAAKRKNFRIAERQRINQLTANAPKTQEKPNKHHPSNENINHVLSKRNLPDMPKGETISESTPETVAMLLDRLQLETNKCFLPAKPKN